MEVSTSPILWQNEDQTVTLFDIPRSIAAAQGTKEHPGLDILVASPPLKAPFATNEPKSQKAQAKVKAHIVDADLQCEYGRVLRNAVTDIRSHHQGPWCLDRLLISEHHGSRPKRKREQSEAADEPAQSLPITSTFQAPISASEIVPDPTFIPQDAHILCSECEDMGVNFHCNASALPTQLHNLGRSTSHMTSQNSYYIPPQSSFLLGDCVDSRTFHICMRNLAQNHDTRRHFDFILLDPPWPNSSVRRTHKTPGSSYATISRLDAVSELLLGTDLDMLMTETCLVGFWITNRPAVRELLLGQDGIFETWSLRLEEEWIWLKTTALGQPVTPIDGYWRKPYEVLLLGRRYVNGVVCNDDATSVPKRRVIVGVPDTHSRKPCLKALVEPLMPSKSDYRALEIFARHLVAGWSSWGNECVKFNASSNWIKREQPTFPR